MANYQPLPPSLSSTLQQSLRRVCRHRQAFDRRFPTVGDGRRYQLTHNDNWVTGFWTGLLWLTYSATQDPELREQAQSLLASFSERLDRRVHINHDLGFLLTLSALAQWQATRSPEARQLALRAATELSHRYRPQGHYLQAWGAVGDPEEGGRIIIDSLMNLPLLFWASAQTGDSTYHHLAAQHATTSLRYLVRPDGSTYHTFFFNQETGAPIGPRTHQGYADDSIWSRGQAWAIYGFALAAEWCRDERFLAAAENTARCFLNNLPPDQIPWWDLSLPAEAPHHRDSSAGAIAAGGLLRLARLTGGEKGAGFRAAAVNLLGALVRECFEADDEAQGLLRHGALHVPKGWGIDSYVIFGDYFFLEALLTLAGEAPDFWGPGEKHALETQQ